MDEYSERENEILVVAVKPCLGSEGLIADSVKTEYDANGRYLGNNHVECIRSPCTSYNSFAQYAADVSSSAVPVVVFLSFHVLLTAAVIPLAVARRLQGAYKHLGMRVLWLLSQAFVTGTWIAMVVLGPMSFSSFTQQFNGFGEPTHPRDYIAWNYVVVLMVILETWQAFVSVVVYVEMSAVLGGLWHRIGHLSERAIKSFVLLALSFVMIIVLVCVGIGTYKVWYIMTPVVLVLASLVQLAAGLLYLVRLLMARPWLKEKDDTDYQFLDGDESDSEGSETEERKESCALRALSLLQRLRRRLAWRRLVPLRLKIALKCVFQVFGSIFLIIHCFATEALVWTPCSAQAECKMMWLTAGITLVSVVRYFAPVCIVTMVPIPEKEKKASAAVGGQQSLSARLDASNLTPETIFSNIPQHLRIDPELLTFGDMIGSGAQGIVFKGEYQQVPVAIKVIQTEKFGTSTDLAGFFNELVALSESHHPHILRLLGVSFDPQKNRLSIVTEFCSFGSLASVLDKCRRKPQQQVDASQSDVRPLTFADKLRILYQICAALAYLHGRGLVHRDVKAENVLLTESFEAKLADLGTAKYMTNETAMTMAVGTSSYIAPEVLKAGMSAEYELAQVSSSDSLTAPMLSLDGGTSTSSGSKKQKKGTYSQKCDCYSMGILMYVLLTENTRPYGQRSEADILLQVVRRDSTFRPPIDHTEPTGKIQAAIEYNARWYIELMQQLWSYLPNDRPSMELVVRILRQKM